MAGLIGSRPLGELLATVLWDRGGAPLHFVLAHVALAFDSTPEALRWLSVVFAVATIPLCYDLGRRLAGPVAGATAALVAAASTALALYGTIGRMYALLAFVSALSADLFARALELRTARSAVVAALAAVLLPAVHPYGAIVVAVEAAVALAVWRGRPLRPALPVLAVGLLLLPFAVADLRLADRFTVGVEGEESLAGPGDAWAQLGRALESFGGGAGWTFAAFLVLGIVGTVVLLRTRTAFAVFGLATLLVPPLLFMLLRTGSVMGLSPRHLIFALPLWAAAVGAGVARLTRGLPPAAAAAGVAAVGLLAVLSPEGGMEDPRDRDNVVLGGGPTAAPTGGREQLGPPREWLRQTVEEGDLLFPFSAVFLAGLPATGEAVTLPYSQTTLLERAVERLDAGAGAVVVAVPTGEAAVDAAGLAEALGEGHDVQVFPSWLLVRAEGPFPVPNDALAATVTVLNATLEAVEVDRYQELRFYVERSLRTACQALLGDTSLERCEARGAGR
ncbi:MAG TPA: glycosyltransferase family 39 protein [Gaiellaceae bacterium]|nr:glycosyltransferase family 39 protein [Gaiellaceae bacterium]